MKHNNDKSSGERTPLFDRDMRYVIGPIEHRDHDAISETAKSWLRATIIAPVAALGVIAIAVAASLDLTASGVDQRVTQHSTPVATVVTAPVTTDTATASAKITPVDVVAPSVPTEIVAPVTQTESIQTQVEVVDAPDTTIEAQETVAAVTPDRVTPVAVIPPAPEAPLVVASVDVQAPAKQEESLVPAIGGPAVYDGDDNADSAIRADVQPDDDPWRSVKIKRGDTLGAIFERFGFEIGDAIRIVKDNYASPLKNLIPGKELHLMASPYGSFNRLRYELGVGKRIEVDTDADDFRIRRIEQEPEIRQREVSGVVASSLFESASQIGLNQNVIMQMADIFAYQIDFALDIRQGDRYSIIFEEKYIDDIKIGDGEIIAAEFINDGNSHRAIRHIDEDDHSQYFTPDGKSLRRAFLRTPVKFSRISSGFSKKRFHPILKKWRAHKGVDYAARRGTPVLATADGKVSFIGRKGGYGKMIELKHGKKYRTRYAHLHKFKKGMRSGRKVMQGDVIGYVGRTGWATGPHLHYEFHVNGKHRNPLTVKLPRSMSIEKRYRDQFTDTALILGGRLDALNANVASYDSGSLRRNNNS